MRVEIHVRPGASVKKVGGTHDGALLVRVTERAADGRATRAALQAIAEALGITQQRVKLIHGASSRRKLVEITAEDPLMIEQQILELRSRPGDGRP